MRGLAGPPPVRRAWTVEITTEQGRIRCRVPGCTGMAAGRPARAAALAHLAWHARLNRLPAHLRICQCRELGCGWHPRHRGCSGPVTLVLLRRDRGRTWHLADVCAACASAAPETATVPDLPEGAQCPPQPSSASPLAASADARPSPAPASVRRRPLLEVDDAARATVSNTLNYLACVLGHTDAPVRLVALVCALQASAAGVAVVPSGLLRAIRLPEPARAVHALVQAGWAVPADGGPVAGPVHGAMTVRIPDLVSSPGSLSLFSVDAPG